MVLLRAGCPVLKWHTFQNDGQEPGNSGFEKLIPFLNVGISYDLPSMSGACNVYKMF